MPALKAVLASLLIGTATVPCIGPAGAKAQTVSQPGIRTPLSAFGTNTGRNTSLAQKTGPDTYVTGLKR